MSERAKKIVFLSSLWLKLGRLLATHFFSAIALLVALFHSTTFALSPNYLSAVDITTSLEKGELKAVAVPQIATLITVRVLANQRAGSGVIIERRGQTYTVLTCAHVVAGSSGNSYTILSADGSKHSARLLRSTQLGDADLALLQFTSKQSYRVAEIGNNNALAVGDRVYAAGFPNWRMINANAIEDTRDRGVKAFRLTTGNVGMIAERALSRGYQLGYTNDIEDGMSGGPVLDSNGFLIGINGRLKYPFSGIQAYTFADGTAPSQHIFQQMEALSWAIPIATFQQKFRKNSGSL